MTTIHEGLQVDHQERRIPLVDDEIDLALPPGTREHLLGLQQREGDIYRLRTRAANFDTIVVSHPDYAEEVLTTRHTQFRRSFLDRAMSLVLGNGLLTSDAERWKSHRKAMQPCFHGEPLMRLLRRAIDLNRDQMKAWKRRIDIGEHPQIAADIHDLCVRLNFDAIFGLDAPRVRQSIDAGFLDQLTAPDKADTRTNLRFLKRLTDVRGSILRLVILRRVRELPAADLLGMLTNARYAAGGAISDEGIVDEVVNLLTAGHETIAVALCAVWEQLSKDSDIVRAIRQETEQLSDDAQWTPRMLTEWRYTKRAIQESLRLSPPLWVIPRVATVDSRVGGFPVPAGTNVLVLTYAVHRHPAFWTRPHHFDPGRFESKTPGVSDAIARHGHAYIPFSNGPRNCIGRELSLMQMVLHVSIVCREFDIQSVEDPSSTYLGGVMLRPKVRAHLRIARRQ